MKARCASGCQVKADERMLYSAMENLVNNAWEVHRENRGRWWSSGCTGMAALATPWGGEPAGAFGAGSSSLLYPG